MFTPWHKIWGMALASLDESQPLFGLRWDSIDRDGPTGFRVNGVKITLADTPGSLAFRHAYVSVGFSPLATVRLDTAGSQCELELHRSGVFEFEGDLNLTSLLGGADFKGALHVAGNFFLPAGASLPKKGWLDLRSQQLLLPDGKTVEDMAFTAEIRNDKLMVRDFSMRHPITLKASGSGTIDPENLYHTLFDLKGEVTIGQHTVPYGMKGTLGDAVLR